LPAGSNEKTAAPEFGRAWLWDDFGERDGLGVYLRAWRYCVARRQWPRELSTALAFSAILRYTADGTFLSFLTLAERARSEHNTKAADAVLEY
jgi:hypothetical protein